MRDSFLMASPIFVTVFAMVFPCCQPLPTPVVTPPDADSSTPVPLGDASPTGTPCERACHVLVNQGCPEGDPTPEGISCAEVCQNVESFPHLAWHSAEIAACNTLACVKAYTRCPK